MQLSIFQASMDASKFDMLPLPGAEKSERGFDA